MGLFRKKKNNGEISLRMPIWRIVITVFVSMLVLAGYFIISSRFNAVISFAIGMEGQMESQCRIAAVQIDTAAAKDFLHHYSRHDTAARSSAFVKKTCEQLKNIDPIDVWEQPSGKGQYRLYFVGSDSAGTYTIASDSAFSYGSEVKYLLKKDSSERIHLILYNGSDTLHKKKADSLQHKFAFYKPVLYSPARAGILIIPSSSLVKDRALAVVTNGIKVSVIIFLVTFIVIFLSLRKVLKREQKVKTTLHDSKRLIEEKSQAITDSISYARRIQQAILPDTQHIFKVLPEAFILYKPKDVVSGDFYAFAEKDGKVLLAAVDCTGHGVPGAFMSMIGHNLLTEIIVGKGITQPSLVLGELNKAVRKALKQQSAAGELQSKDGMDAAIITLNLQNNTLQYAGANRPLWIIRGEHPKSLGETVNPAELEKKLVDIKPTKASIGGHTQEDIIFEHHEIPVQHGDSIYLFSDGFADQFGGPEGKKLMTKRFKEILLSLHYLDMKAQEAGLDKAFEQWKNNQEQVDDVLVMGVRI